MTKKLRQALYPECTHATFCKHYLVEDPIAMLLDPTIDTTASNCELLSILKNCKDLKKHMPAFFERIEVLKKLKWTFTVKSLFAEQGRDGEFYHHRHPVITLLLESSWRLLHQGLLVLDYSKTNSFLNHYAAEKPRSMLLNHDLSHALGHLGLSFIEDITYPNIVMFDSISQSKLHHAGYHYSLQFGKALLLTANRFRMFKPSILPLEMQESILSASEPTLSHQDLNLLEQLLIVMSDLDMTGEDVAKVRQ